MLKRFLLAYTVFYSVSVAAKIAESKDFYGEMINGDFAHWPRGHERRHCRGETFKKCIESLIAFDYRHPEKIVDFWVMGKDFKGVSRNVQSFYGYGDWISFKIYDLIDRVLCIPTDKAGVDLYMYKEPIKGAALYKFGDQTHAITSQEVSDVVTELLNVYRNYKAPPFADRPLSIMEVETCLCKGKSNYNGHYSLGNDTVDIYKGLEEGDWGDLAQELKFALQPYYDQWKDMPWDQRNVKITV
jgi:hypothetical protein